MQTLSVISSNRYLTIALFYIVSNHEGYNISTHGGRDGWIEASTDGGSTPYTYVWSVAGTKNKIEELVVGSYSVTLTDANGCTTTGSATLTEPSLLHAV